VPETGRSGSRAGASGALAALAPALALIGLVVVVLPGVFRGGALYLRDINMVWLPQAESFVRNVAAGGGPLWDPYSGFGRPLLADPRAEILYPPTWLNLVVRPATYYALFAVAHLLLAGAGMWRLARGEGLGTPAAAAAAGLWVASGPLLSLVSMWHHLAAAAWIPWIVSTCDEVAGRPSRRAVVMAAAAVAVQVLAGSPDITVLTLLIVFARVAGALATADETRRRRVARLGALVGAGVLAAALSAAQWIPTLDVVRRATRWSGGPTGSGTWSLHPQALPEILIPMRWADMPLTAPAMLALLENKEPWMRSVYLGAAAAGLVAAGLLTSGRRRVSLGLLLVLAVALALGDHGPVYPLVAAVPGARALRYPVKALLVAAFAWSLLAGAGLQALLDGSRRARAGTMATAVAVAAGLLAARWVVPAVRPGIGGLGSLFAAPPPAWVGPPVSVAAGFAMLTAAVAWSRDRASPAIVGLALALVAVGDAAWRHRALNPTASRALLAYRPDALRALDRRGGGRVYVYDYSIDPGVDSRPHPWPYRLARQPADWTPSAALVLGVHAYLNPPTAARWGVFGSYDLDILGFDSVPVDRLTRFLRTQEGTPGHLRLLQVGAVAQVLALEPAPWWTDLVPVTEVEGFFQDPIHVFRVPDARPRAYVVDGVRIADGEAALGMLVDPSFDPQREVVLPAGPGRSAGEGAAGTAAIQQMESDSVEVAVDMRREGRLVLVDAYDPGWRADVDDHRVEIERANVAFRAVAVPAGRHTVRFRYRPPAVGAGIVLSALALMAAAVLFRRPRGEREPC
jgi:hypothetical protein